MGDADFDQPPLTQEEYEERHLANLRYSGKGLATRTHFPCPFCAASDFMTWSLMPGPESVEVVMAKGARCRACDRGARMVFERSRGVIRMELVQTYGPVPPPWANLRQVVE